jgi:hypothetical protein
MCWQNGAGWARGTAWRGFLQVCDCIMCPRQKDCTGIEARAVNVWTRFCAQQDNLQWVISCLCLTWPHLGCCRSVKGAQSKHSGIFQGILIFWWEKIQLTRDLTLLICVYTDISWCHRCKLWQSWCLLQWRLMMLSVPCWLWSFLANKHWRSLPNPCKWMKGGW